MRLYLCLIKGSRLNEVAVRGGTSVREAVLQTDYEKVCSKRLYKTNCIDYDCR